MLVGHPLHIPQKVISIRLGVEGFVHSFFFYLRSMFVNYIILLINLFIYFNLFNIFKFINYKNIGNNNNNNREKRNNKKKSIYIE